jgi:putative PIN family toxin of toxin-antitoxin system
VLDTNIVLDWLVFEDPSTAALRTDVAGGRTRVLTHDLAIEELRRVLAYPHFKLEASEQDEVLREYTGHAERVALPEGFSADNLLLPAGFPRCRDRDDEHFLALAFHARADALVSKDKAVLKLRRRARRFGVEVLNAVELTGRR